jgi:hypothetical protein
MTSFGYTEEPSDSELGEAKSGGPQRYTEKKVFSIQYSVFVLTEYRIPNTGFQPITGFQLWNSQNKMIQQFVK